MVIDKIGLAVIDGSKLLVVKNRGTSKWIMPGGRVESGEDPEQTLRREIDEELSCSVDSLQYVGEYCDEAANDEGAMVKIRLYQGRLLGNIRIANEIETYTWFDMKSGDERTLSKIIRDQILPDIRARRGSLDYARDLP